MRVFVHEFMTSGAMSGEAMPPSLLREGLAMRQAVAAAFLDLPGVRVVTTSDPRVPPAAIAGLEDIVARDAAAEADLFRTQCSEADRCLIIAPEIDGELQRRVSQAVELAGRERVLNSPGLVAAASDKWETYLRLKRAGVPTIETRLGSSDESRTWDLPIVKPRLGAGSQNVMRLSRRETALPTDFPWSRTGLDDRPERWIVQPFVSGRWLSCSILFRPGGGIDVWPPAEQRISTDGTFAYLGGVLPAACDAAAIQSLTLRAIRAVAPDDQNLAGPIGVDLVEDAATGELLVCEVNPRFTTSFVAARERAGGNLLAGLLWPDAEPAAWKAGRVEFDAAGAITLTRTQPAAEPSLPPTEY